MDCPEAIYQLMLDTWQKERSHRPKFAELLRVFDHLLRAPEVLRKIACVNAAAAGSAAMENNAANGSGESSSTAATRCFRR